MSRIRPPAPRFGYWLAAFDPTPRAKNENSAFFSSAHVQCSLPMPKTCLFVSSCCTARFAVPMQQPSQKGVARISCFPRTLFAPLSALTISAWIEQTVPTAGVPHPTEMHTSEIESQVVDGPHCNASALTADGYMIHLGTAPEVHHTFTGVARLGDALTAGAASRGSACPAGPSRRAIVVLTPAPACARAIPGRTTASKERIVGLLLSDGRQRPVTRTKQSLSR
jgi:hypothetical protein